MQTHSIADSGLAGVFSMLMALPLTWLPQINVHFVTSQKLSNIIFSPAPSTKTNKLHCLHQSMMFFPNFQGNQLRTNFRPCCMELIWMHLSLTHEIEWLLSEFNILFSKLAVFQKHLNLVLFSPLPLLLLLLLPNLSQLHHLRLLPLLLAPVNPLSLFSSFRHPLPPFPLKPLI